MPGKPGLDEEVARFLGSRQVPAAGADNMALEVLPFVEPRRVFPVRCVGGTTSPATLVIT